MSFTGFPVAALDFYDDLEMDNTKSFWEANKAVWKDSVEAPMKALVAALEPEFGTAKVFRPYRDVRFAKDKTPYKTHQGAFVGAGPSTGWYVEISARGTRVGAGFYDADGPRLAAIREAMADEKTGKALERLLKRLEKDGFEVGGDRLKTSPRGYDADHPRIHLLRCKQLFANKSYGFEADAIDAGLVDRVREDWKTLRPLVSWLRGRSTDSTDCSTPDDAAFTRATPRAARLAPWPRDCSCSTSVPTRWTSRRCARRSRSAGSPCPTPTPRSSTTPASRSGARTRPPASSASRSRARGRRCAAAPTRPGPTAS